MPRRFNDGMKTNPSNLSSWLGLSRAGYHALLIDLLSAERKLSLDPASSEFLSRLATPFLLTFTHAHPQAYLEVF